MRKLAMTCALVGVLAVPNPARAGGFHLEVGVGPLRGSVHFRDRARRSRGAWERRVWIPGQYVTRVEYVRIPGCWRSEWVPPATKRVCSFGAWRICTVRPGHWRKVWVPPRTVPRTTRVWVPGHWR